MRNFILLLKRFRVFLLFIILQVLSLYLLVQYNKSHQARWMSWSYEVTGHLNKWTGTVTQYFGLVAKNKALSEENNRLRNLLGQNFVSVDTTGHIVSDTALIDSVPTVRKYFWRKARVVNNSVNSQANFITIQRGSRQGVEPQMAVVGPNGIVGVVTDVSDNMAIVMSMLHRKNATSVRMKNTGHNGILEWDGRNAGLLQLKGIPQSAKVVVGDTVLTSNISINFPPGLMVGTVAEIGKQQGFNNYLLQIKPATNFHALDYVDVIENSFIKEQQEIERRIKKAKEEL